MNKCPFVLCRNSQQFLDVDAFRTASGLVFQLICYKEIHNPITGEAIGKSLLSHQFYWTEIKLCSMYRLALLPSLTYRPSNLHKANEILSRWQEMYASTPPGKTDRPSPSWRLGVLPFVLRTTRSILTRDVTNQSNFVCTYVRFCSAFVPFEGNCPEDRTKCLLSTWVDFW